MKQQFELMAQYNQWMNSNIYRSLSGLPTAELSKHRGAYFRSILGTLNHIMVADIIWLKRFAEHPARFVSLEHVRGLPAPIALAEVLYADLDSWHTARVTLDSAIIEFIGATAAHNYLQVLHYQDTKGQPLTKQFGYLLQHFFNHQTHHRGQVSTLLSQLDIDIGTTDLLALIPDPPHR